MLISMNVMRFMCRKQYRGITINPETKEYARLFQISKYYFTRRTSHEQNKPTLRGLCGWMQSNRQVLVVEVAHMYEEAVCQRT